MNSESIVTTFGPVLALILGNAAFIIPLFLWNRSESRADIRYMDSKLEATRELVRAIYDETRDFHARLCSICACEIFINAEEPKDG